MYIFIMIFIYFIVTSFMIALTLQVSIRCEEDGIALQGEGTYFFASPPESNVSCSISYTFMQSE